LRLAPAVDTPGAWQLAGPGFSLQLRPRVGGQIGAFPEQLPHWEWLRRVAARAPRRLRVLNLFAHSGGATLACAASANAQTTHVDSSRASLSLARANAQASHLDGIRWLCDDAMTFVNRAVRNGDRYDGVIADPPAFGRGPSGSKDWRIARDLPELVGRLTSLLSDEPAFVLLTTHDQDWGEAQLRGALGRIPQLRAGGLRASAPPLPRPGDCAQTGLESGQSVLRASELGGAKLPMGAYARWSSSSCGGLGVTGGGSELL